MVTLPTQNTEQRDYVQSYKKHWEGPYVLIDKINDVIYRIRKGPKYKPKLVHQDRLTSYKGEIKIEIIFSGVRVTRSLVFIC